jgi:EAL domain-containing protein (putative c-di-GMP-specific phosphodiesterase class I)
MSTGSSQPETADLILAVNVSVSQFRQADFVERVLAVLDLSGANPQRLKLELTESMLVDNLDDIIGKMFALKARGVGFSLDDFGTGYSSLSYLKRLPLDQLKIDRSFVRDVLTDPNDAAIARTIVALSQSLGLSVMAEGVETEAQRAFLARHGCHIYQGYYFSRPIPSDDFVQLAAREQCHRL